MPDFSAYAPAKVILFGEHAVVYGQPALAAPVLQMRARAHVSAGLSLPPGTVRIEAPVLNLSASLADLPEQDPLGAAIRLTFAHLNVTQPPACTIYITSNIPMAAGLGSGAAASVAMIRALSAFLGKPLSDDDVCALTFEVEKLHHGTPSGVDNTVIAYAKPVYFEKSLPGDAPAGGLPVQMEMLGVAVPFTLVIGDTGIASSTKTVVGAVRTAWQSRPRQYEEIFAQIGTLVRAARVMIENGTPHALGTLMNTNHILLQQLDVSCPELDNLVEAALNGGALGAKLSGGGRGGNMIALVPPSGNAEHDQQSAAEIVNALRSAGAVKTLVTTIAPA